MPGFPRSNADHAVRHIDCMVLPKHLTTFGRQGLRITIQSAHNLLVSGQPHPRKHWRVFAQTPGPVRASFTRLRRRRRGSVDRSSRRLGGAGDFLEDATVLGLAFVAIGWSVRAGAAAGLLRGFAMTGVELRRSVPADR